MARIDRESAIAKVTSSTPQGLNLDANSIALVLY